MELFAEEFVTDLIAFVISAASVTAYYLFLNARVRKNPTYSIHGVNALSRRLWVEHIMRSNSAKDIMAVQTLRNFIMAPTLMASTAALLIIGTLTLSGQAENISHSWHVLSIGGSHATQLWILKVMLLLVDFIVAFFAFAMCIRLANHVLFMVNVPEHGSHQVLSPRAVSHRLNRAGNMFAIGMRAFFFAIPMVFWLFGPYFLLISSIGLVIALYQLDRSECLEARETESGSDAPEAPVVSMHAKYAHHTK